MELLSTKYRVRIRKFLTKYRNTMFTIMAIIAMILAFLFFVMFISVYISNNRKSAQLFDLMYQDIEQYKQDDYTKNDYSSRNTIDDMITLEQDLKSEKQNYLQYQQALASPYTNFLNYIFLPTLNIWKDHYTQKIDTTLIGAKFLQANPYTDLALIDTWTKVFQDIENVSEELGVAASNEVKDIQIGAINELPNGFFSIPISLSFESANRRSFLLLMEKLAMTSHYSNITMINEFMLNVREAIKREYKTELESYVINEGTFATETDIDRKLGYLMYQRVKQDGPNFVDGFAKKKAETGAINPKTMDDIIAQSIRSAAGCTDQSQAECEYLFREKFRTVPYLIYPITNPRKKKSDTLHEFLQNTIPPIIKVKEFTFNEQKALLPLQEAKYTGIVKIEVFGRGISDQELSEISKALGEACFVTPAPLTIERGQQVIEQAIVEISKINTLDTTRAQELFELRDLFAELQVSYAGLTQYNKAVKLFEAYRMLDDGALCK